MRAWFIFDSFLNGRERRKFKNNTWIERRDENTIAMRLHQTDIVTVSKTGEISLNMSHYNTVTTRDRIKRALQMIFANSGVTRPRLSSRQGTAYFHHPINGTYEFYNHMTIDASSAKPVNYWKD